MKYLRFFIYIVIFFVIGEITVRIDKYLRPFADVDTVNTAIKIEESDEYRMLTNKSLPINDSDLRVMVLGDSYIYGAGINHDKNFANQLRSLLKQSNKNYRNVYVLDLARPSNNNLDNYNTYFQFVSQFNPNVVVLGYNLNDTDGNLNAGGSSPSLSKTGSFPDSTKENAKLINKISKIIHTSELAGLLMSGFNRQLKTLGYVIPSSEFGQELRSYYMNEPSWIKSKELLREVISDATHRKIKFITFCLPEMDLLNSPKIFYAADTSIQNFFNFYPDISFINGRDLFKGKKSEDYRLSKYDGHPNEKAHLFMANHVNDIISKW